MDLDWDKEVRMEEDPERMERWSVDSFADVGHAGRLRDRIVVVGSVGMARGEGESRHWRPSIRMLAREGEGETRRGALSS